MALPTGEGNAAAPSAAAGKWRVIEGAVYATPSPWFNRMPESRPLPIDLPSLAPPAPGLSGRERFRAWLDMWLVDHGFIRDIYCNIHPVAKGVWRSAQPAPRHLRWAKRQGIRTILNLRGRRDTCGSYILEREACQSLGLTLVDFPIRSRSPLDKETLRAAAGLFDQLEYPILMHCKSGADRAGFMADLGKRSLQVSN